MGIRMSEIIVFRPRGHIEDLITVEQFEMQEDAE